MIFRNFNNRLRHNDTLSLNALDWTENDNVVPLWKTIMPRLNGLDYKGRPRRLVILQLTTMALPVIPLVAITPSDNANGGNDEDLSFEMHEIFCKKGVFSNCVSHAM